KGNELGIRRAVATADYWNGIYRTAIKMGFKWCVVFRGRCRTNGQDAFYWKICSAFITGRGYHRGAYPEQVLFISCFCFAGDDFCVRRRAPLPGVPEWYF